MHKYRPVAPGPRGPDADVRKMLASGDPGVYCPLWPEVALWQLDRCFMKEC